MENKKLYIICYTGGRLLVTDVEVTGETLESIMCHRRSFNKKYLENFKITPNILSEPLISTWTLNLEMVEPLKEQVTAIFEKRSRFYSHISGMARIEGVSVRDLIFKMTEERYQQLYKDKVPTIPVMEWEKPKRGILLRKDQI